MIACSCDVTITPGPAAATVSPSAGTASASPSPGSAPTLAVITGPTGTLRLAGSDGTVRATTTYEVAPFRPHRFMSWTSVSLTTLYYLNGGSEVRFLKPDGTTGSATRIAVGAGEQAGFAVDPTDRRIAVAVFAYTPAPADSQGVAQPTYKGMRLYVEDLQGGGHRVDIFSSATVAEFPIGWATGNVILAVSTPFCCQARAGQAAPAASAGEPLREQLWAQRPDRARRHDVYRAQRWTDVQALGWQPLPAPVGGADLGSVPQRDLPRRNAGGGRRRTDPDPDSFERSTPSVGLRFRLARQGPPCVPATRRGHSVGVRPHISLQHRPAGSRVPRVFPGLVELAVAAGDVDDDAGRDEDVDLAVFRQ